MYIEIDNIELGFGGKQLLNGVYLKAETGKITAVMGANGCGKSSLLNIIFGNLDPRHKLIRINSTPHLKPLFTYRGMVKYLPQHSFLPTHLKLSSIFKLYEVSWDEFTEEFSFFSEYYNSRITEVSGGERRIAETYLIIKSKAEVLLLDEPFTHLAPVYIETFRKILRQEAKQKAVIITDHLYSHIIDLADELYFINNGCTRLIKDPAELEQLNYLTSR
ncbi:ATP-binding cassette domain-containing protein [Antarcticibacterium flavum]|uniref:ATP-binding cassette domain-containing protein n=1 Tax=Antarcticibacterium flavum TaxID=2058175 RepID=A0A5B7WZT0_9FLAO|nr:MULTISPECIES: ATP-binding cassette domain-containing protein [Antarcticibacterium]MCM4160718.1 ABC transporter ATP-binding protein [Antarcticibacterium sp. W02-3]QCY68804.1 ATP-binding cassette domain-containing protein [Antarcticibacterium flavum]